MAHIIAWFAGTHDAELAARFRTAVVHADTPATHLLRFTKAQAERSMARFRSKEANLLVATNAAEEGMDVPQANAVLRFDPMHTAVSLVQGRGRAREAHSDFVVLNQRADRPVAELQAAERRQADLILKEYGAGAPRVADVPAADAAADAAAALAQRSRETNARGLLQEQRAPDTAAMHLNAFCSKTKLSPLYKESRQGPTAYVCTVTVTTGTAGTVTGTATGPTKQAAKHGAAADAIAQLRRRFGV
jgi:superfamily II DNA/RNA helicase